MNRMWYLEAFDRESELQVRDYAMPGLTTAILKNLLNLGEAVEIGGVKYPLEAGGYDIPPETTPSFAEYIDGPFKVDDSLDYQVGFYDE
ncbi:hypothetical protein ACFYVR_24515 [Rhodococcus sp. NPDC003318]|uniref:DUF7683 domain-containing protein n=1 Tax=Rhodococcus sp. NPDC003318 TaxID=3364503 RepID=UPI0036758AE5